jgi:hypothetical protein
VAAGVSMIAGALGTVLPQIVGSAKGFPGVIGATNCLLVAYQFGDDSDLLGQQGKRKDTNVLNQMIRKTLSGYIRNKRIYKGFQPQTCSSFAVEVNAV